MLLLLYSKKSEIQNILGCEDVRRKEKRTVNNGSNG